MSEPRRRRTRSWTARLGAALAVLTVGTALAGAQEPPESFVVSGTGTVRVVGPHCCGGSAFAADFDASYSVDRSGVLRMQRLEAALEDADVSVPGLLGIGTREVHLRCSSLAAIREVTGSVGAGGRLSIPAGAAAVQAAGYDTRDAAGECSGTVMAFEAVSNGALSGIHDPASGARGRFELRGTFRGEVDNGWTTDVYDVQIELVGAFRNRPPRAAFGLVTAESPQGSCPGVPDGGNPPELVAEATSAGGIKGVLRSTSTDPDGLWPREDIESELWLRGTGPDPLPHAGHGESLGPLVFALGPETHRIALLASDRRGAQSRSDCAFRVVDTRRPSLVVPSPITVECSTEGGTKVSDSPQLQWYLGAASASDVADPSPVVAPPTVGGVAVTASTLFPLDFTSGGPTTVEFSARDRSGNVERASSTVSVVDTTLPEAALELSASVVPATGTWLPVDARLDSSDVCGPTRAVLFSIASNDPALDAGDIRGATFGTDDRSFELLARLTSGGAMRIYLVTYRVVDAAGNSSFVERKVVVTAEGK